MKKIFRFMRGIISITLFFIALLLTSIVLLTSALFIFIINIPRILWAKIKGKNVSDNLFGRSGMGFLLNFFRWWMDSNKWIMCLSVASKWDIQGPSDLDPNGWYLMISNHRSWLDILVIGRVFHRKLPIIKFFMKKELLWTLPLAGLGTYILGYPFLERHTREDIRKHPELKNKDIESTKKACEKLKLFPTAIINFAEGTRFTLAKQKRQQSPYQNLLKPKATGIAFVLKETHDRLQGIINVTIRYTPDELTLWSFACGNVDKIKVHYEILPITDDLIGDYYENREFRVHFQKWLNQLWQKKDLLLK